MKALLLLIVSGILAGSVFILGKQAGQAPLSPLVILFWQMSGGALVVWLVMWLLPGPTRRFPTWDVVHVRYYLIGGLLGISIPYLLAFIVLQQLQVGLVGLLTALSPVVTYAMARLLGQEDGHPLRLLGLIVGLCGVAMLVSPRQEVDLTAEWSYLLLALGIPVSLAASNIYRSRYWPAGSEAMPLVAGMLTLQGAWLLVANLLLGNAALVLPSQQETAWLLGVLAFMSGASYLSSFNLLRVGGPVYLSQMGYVITTVTVLAGIIIWGEHYDQKDIWSMGLILTGVLFTTWARSPRRMKIEYANNGAES